jgi:transcriptional regulator of heat shock response
MLDKRYKPYKKGYKKGEKVYHLHMYCSWNNATIMASLRATTVISVRHQKWRHPIEVSNKNNTEHNVFPEWVAPRTPEGKKFLQDRAKNIIQGKMKYLMKEANKQQEKLRQLMETFD